MNYYTSIIPPTLAEKLKEKGMPIRYEQTDEGIRPMTMFAECFDWLVEKGIYISMSYLGILQGKKPSYEAYMNWNDTVKEEIIVKHTWHEAANAAVEKALTLI